MAIEAGYCNLIVEGNNQIVMQALQGKGKTPWQMQGIMCLES